MEERIFELARFFGHSYWWHMTEDVRRIANAVVVDKLNRRLARAYIEKINYPWKFPSNGKVA